MNILILGVNGSGKSICGEKLAVKLSNGSLYYIATMIPYGKGGQVRVEKHRKQRASMGFITIEKPFDLSDIPFEMNSTALLEDVSNLLGNAMFGSERRSDGDDVFADITDMCEKCRNCVMVSIIGLAQEAEFDDETNSYIDALNRLNNRLFEFSETVIIMSDGMPVCVKGDTYAMD